MDKYKIISKINLEIDKDIYMFLKDDIYMYIIQLEDIVKDFRYLLITNKKYELGYEFYETELKFTNDINKYIDYIKNFNQLKNIKNIEITNDLYFFLNNISSNKKLKLNIHTDKFCEINNNWYKKKNINLKQILKKSKNTNINIDLYESFLSNLIRLDESVLNDNEINIDLGGTGKTSILSQTSKVIDSWSEAGLFGYGDVSVGKFIGGIIHRSKNKPIIIDEINNTSIDNQLNLNSALENGVYSNGKAIGGDIIVKNKFILNGNINNDEKYNLNSLIHLLFSNPRTMGRRFGWIRFDMHSKKGINYYKFEEYELDIISLLLSDKFKKFKKYFIRWFNKKQIQQLIESNYKKRISYIDKLENYTLKKFLNDLDYKRLFIRASKIVFIENYSKLNNYNNLNSNMYIYLSKLYNEIIEKFRSLIDKQNKYIIQIINQYHSNILETNNDKFSIYYNNSPNWVKNLLINLKESDSNNYIIDNNLIKNYKDIKYKIQKKKIDKEKLFYYGILDIYVKGKNICLKLNKNLFNEFVYWKDNKEKIKEDEVLDATGIIEVGELKI